MRKNNRLYGQFFLILLILFFSSIYLSIASKHEFVRSNTTGKEINFLNQPILVQSSVRINYRSDSGEIEVFQEIRIPLILSSNEEYYFNISKVTLDILYIETFHLTEGNFSASKICGVSSCTENVYHFENKFNTGLGLIFTRLVSHINLVGPNNIKSILNTETDNLSYMKESALIYGFIIILLLFFSLVFLSFYKNKVEYPNLENDEHFRITYLVEYFVRKRLLLKFSMILLFYIFIIYEHNPHLFDTRKWYSSDLIYFSSLDFNGIELFIMSALYLGVELIYFLILYFKDNDLKQWVTFIDSDEDLNDSIKRLFLNPFYSVVFPMVLAFIYHDPCTDCLDVSGIVPRSGDYGLMIDILRIEIGFFIILLYAQYSRTRAK